MKYGLLHWGSMQATTQHKNRMQSSTLGHHTTTVRCTAVIGWRQQLRLLVYQTHPRLVCVLCEEWTSMIEQNPTIRYSLLYMVDHTRVDTWGWRTALNGAFYTEKQQNKVPSIKAYHPYSALSAARERVQSVHEQIMNAVMPRWHTNS